MARYATNALIAFTLLLIEFTAFAGEKIRLAYPESAQSHLAAREILHRAYKKLGKTIEIVSMPWKRALIATNNGVLDGEVARLTLIEQDYTNLVRVPTPLYPIDFYAYTATPQPSLQNWPDLAGKRIGMQLGVVIFEQKTRGMNRVMHDDMGDLVAMLKRGGIDVILNTRRDHMTSPPYSLYQSARLEREYFYHYLHRSHAALVAPLSEVLYEMQQSGEIDAIITGLDETISRPD